MKKDTVTIIGSINSSKEEIKKAIVWCYKNMNIGKVYDPIKNNSDAEHKPLWSIQLRYINCIKESDFAILIRKPDETIGESTSYELALCCYFKNGTYQYSVYCGPSL